METPASEGVPKTARTLATVGSTAAHHGCQYNTNASSSRGRQNQYENKQREGFHPATVGISVTAGTPAAAATGTPEHQQQQGSKQQQWLQGTLTAERLFATAGWISAAEA